MNFLCTLLANSKWLPLVKAFRNFSLFRREKRVRMRKVKMMTREKMKGTKRRVRRKAKRTIKNI